MKLPTLFLYTLAVVFTSCSVVSSNSTESRLVGQWEWIQSSGGFSGQTTTPDSAGHAVYYLNLNSDWTFSYTRADTLFKAGIYSLKKRDGDTIISYKTADHQFSVEQRISFRNNDTLILADECADCYISTYVRK